MKPEFEFLMLLSRTVSGFYVNEAFTEQFQSMIRCKECNEVILILHPRFGLSFYSANVTARKRKKLSIHSCDDTREAINVLKKHMRDHIADHIQDDIEY